MIKSLVLEVHEIFGPIENEEVICVKRINRIKKREEKKTTIITFQKLNEIKPTKDSEKHDIIFTGYWRMKMCDQRPGGNESE